MCAFLNILFLMSFSYPHPHFLVISRYRWLKYQISTFNLFKSQCQIFHFPIWHYHLGILWTLWANQIIFFSPIFVLFHLSPRHACLKLCLYLLWLILLTFWVSHSPGIFCSHQPHPFSKPSLVIINEVGSFTLSLSYSK